MEPWEMYVCAVTILQVQFARSGICVPAEGRCAVVVDTVVIVGATIGVSQRQETRRWHDLNPGGAGSLHIHVDCRAIGIGTRPTRVVVPF